MKLEPPEWEAEFLAAQNFLPLEQSPLIDTLFLDRVKDNVFIINFTGEENLTKTRDILKNNGKTCLLHNLIVKFKFLDSFLIPLLRNTIPKRILNSCMFSSNLNL
jgi:hypothetical protein